jgi:hypothetical protein
MAFVSYVAGLVDDIWLHIFIMTYDDIYVIAFVYHAVIIFDALVL